MFSAQCHLGTTLSRTTSNWVSSDILGSRRKGLLPFLKSSGVLLSQLKVVIVYFQIWAAKCLFLWNIISGFLPQGQVHPYCNQDSPSLVIDSPLFQRVWNWLFLVSLSTRAAFYYTHALRSLSTEKMRCWKHGSVIPVILNVVSHHHTFDMKLSCIWWWALELYNNWVLLIGVTVDNLVSSPDLTTGG